MRKHFYLFVIACMVAVESFAANNTVVFKTSTGTYTDLTGATPITTAVLAYDSFLVSSLAGETFALFGKSITMQPSSIMIMDMARIQMSEDTAFAMIDGLFAEQLDSIDNTSSVSYKLEGSGNKKIFKVQWKNLKIHSGPPGNFINAQIWLYEETGIIEYHYGPRSANNASGYTNPNDGVYIGIWYSNYTFSKMYEKVQVIGQMPNFSVDSNLNMTVPNVEGVPAEGTIFRFVPKKAATSVQTISEDKLQVFPNPAGDALTISFTSTARTPTTISLTDMQGRVVYKGNSDPAINKHNIPTHHIPAGIYQLNIQGAGIHSSNKITIQH